MRPEVRADQRGGDSAEGGTMKSLKSVKGLRKAQKLLGCIVTLGGCLTSTVIMLIGGLVLALGVVLPFTPLIIVGAVVCVIAIVCFVVARLLANVVDGPG
jgi:hypothetical protein